MSASLKDYRTHYISIPAFSIQSLFHSLNLFLLRSIKTKIGMNTVSGKGFCAQKPLGKMFNFNLLFKNEVMSSKCYRFLWPFFWAQRQLKLRVKLKRIKAALWKEPIGCFTLQNLCLKWFSFTRWTGYPIYLIMEYIFPIMVLKWLLWMSILFSSTTIGRSALRIEIQWNEPKISYSTFSQNDKRVVHLLWRFDFRHVPIILKRDRAV